MKQTHDRDINTVLYIRSNHPESFNLQKLKGEKYADQHSLLIDIIVDRNTSGLKPLFERTGMRRILQMIENKDINTLIVDSLCRVNRDGYQLLLFKHYLRAHNTKLVVLDGGV
jgi:DNA invertase Pin-like site-specific DNA recombinase